MKFRDSENIRMFLYVYEVCAHVLVYVIAHAYASRGHRLKTAVSLDYLYFKEGLSLEPGVC